MARAARMGRMAAAAISPLDMGFSDGPAATSGKAVLSAPVGARPAACEAVGRSDGVSTFA